MTRAGRRALTGLLAGLFFLPLSVGVAAAAPTDPAQWPDDVGLNPELTATPHTIRYAGADRYGTNLAMSLALRGKGGYPFDTSDRTSGNAATLAAASGWWGASSCPRSIILVAGDTFADALSAASLSDPTDLSNQPLLKRVAASDPSFDPIGGMDRPDTASAP
ncbi:MAG: cell wall-binding repeat-containing protein, partial [Acidobacteria bacterium]|nr:cell wall-binding repeat-containing protein [Acidobacteriota bacterium]